MRTGNSGGQEQEKIKGETTLMAKPKICVFGGGRPLSMMIPYLMPLPSRCSWRVLHAAPPAPCSHMGVARRGRGWVLISCGLDLCDDVKECFWR